MTERRAKRPPGRPRTVDREGTIERAMVTYWREGLSALSVNELCRRIAIPKPTLYREFGDADGLMVAALDRYRERIVLPVLAVFAEDGPPAEAIERVTAMMTKDFGMPPGCLFTKMRLAPAELGPSAEARVRAIERERRKAFAAWYRRSLAAGTVDPSLSPPFAARYLDNQLTTLLVQMALGESPDDVRAQARLALSALLSS